MLLIVELNDLCINMRDIGSYYMNVDTKERLQFTAVSEWVNRQIRQVINICALYGFKSSGEEWMKQFTYYISHTLAFKPYVGVDNSVYLKLERDEHGNEYYRYIILYVDYMLCIHKDKKK